MGGVGRCTPTSPSPRRDSCQKGRRLGGSCACLKPTGLFRRRRDQPLRGRKSAGSRHRNRIARGVCPRGRRGRDLDAADERPSRERSEPATPGKKRFPRRRPARTDRAARRPPARHVVTRTTKRGGEVIKVEAVVVRERVETVIDAVEEETSHVGVTVVEAIGHGRQRGVTHEYRGRVFESRFLPKALLTFIVEDGLAPAVVAAISDAAQSGNDSGDAAVTATGRHAGDRKSTRLNSSHQIISYAVFCLKK